MKKITKHQLDALLREKQGALNQITRRSNELQRSLQILTNQRIQLTGELNILTELRRGLDDPLPGKPAKEKPKKEKGGD